MVSMLGTILAGAASGAGAADDKNVTEANKQIAAQNLELSHMEVQNMYDQAKMGRQFAMTSKMRSLMQETLATDVPKILAQQKLVSDESQLTPAMRKAGWKVATLKDNTVAAGNALMNNGWIGGDEILKAAASENNSADKVEGQLQGIAAKNVGNAVVAQIAAGGQANRGVAAAGLYSGASIQNAQTAAQAKVQAAYALPGQQPPSTGMLGGGAPAPSNVVQWGSLK